MSIVCECNQTVDVKCGICDLKCGTEKKNCRIHGPFMICGKPGVTCDECQRLGLLYVSGHGGSPYILNKTTGEEFFTSGLTKPFIDHVLQLNSSL